jgi:hypothetical protein
MSLEMRRGLRLVATNDTSCATAIDGMQRQGRDGGILLSRSVDEGRTWKLAGVVKDAVESAREGPHVMAASQSGGMCCVWLDPRKRRTEIIVAVRKTAVLVRCP